jgi:hypothetical protein
MSDERIRELERRVAGGDPDAQAQLDIEILRICEHKGEQYLSMVGGMWGTGHMWCSDCGTCMSDPEQEPRPHGARKHREFTEAIKKGQARLNAMTDEEREQWNREVLEKMRESRAKLAEQLKPAKLAEQLKPFQQNQRRRYY